MRLKKKFTNYLLAIAILLLLVNVAIDQFKKPKKVENVNELSTKQIESVFLSVLNEYGIKDNWIKTKRLIVEDEDSISKQFFVNIPADLPIPFIIKDINNIIEKDITGFVSEEKKIFGQTEIRIYTNEILKLKATLFPDSNAVRRRNQLSFIITDAYNLSEGDFNALLQFPYSLAFLVVPGESVITKVDSLNRYSKGYSVLLNDEITDSKFKFESNYQKKLLKSSVTAIVNSFKNAGLYIIDEKSQLYNSAVYNFVRDEFLKYRIELYKISNFVTLNETNENELISRFRFHCLDTSKGTQKIFLISYENFQKLCQELEKEKKIGNRVIPLSGIELVRKRFVQKSK